MDQIDINRLWQNFTDTITNHYTDFNGRVGRTQFWYYIAVYIVVAILVSIVGSIVGIGSGLRGLFSLALLLPNIGMTARRLQDTGRPGTWAWLLIVPLGLAILTGIFAFATWFALGLFGLWLILAPLMSLLGLASLAVAIALIYFCAQPGTSGPNQYGPEPAQWSPNAPPATPATPPPAAT
ncbi:MAG TPA: DUF805 domain-containing protein [Rhizomicrobium sp.]|jgi:uncharacterized membrane protein YhaH (DUF805 family)